MNKNVLSIIVKTIGILMVVLSLITTLFIYFSGENGLPLFMIKYRWFIFSLGNAIVLLVNFACCDKKNEEQKANFPKTKNSFLFWGFFKGTLTNEQLIEALDKLKHSLSRILFWVFGIMWVIFIVVLILKTFFNNPN